MNLPEYFAMVLDELEEKYTQVIEVCDITNPDEKYASEEAEFRLLEIAANREVLKDHNTYAAIDNVECNIPSCVGCGCVEYTSFPRTWDVNDCPTLRALVKPHHKRADYGSWS